MQRILVTGGAGFIGAHTVRLLLQQGFRVIAYDNLSGGSFESLPLGHSALECVEKDILDYPALLAAMRECDAVLHLAAIVSVPASFKDPLLSLKVNTQGFLHVLQAMRELSHRVRLVYASSAAVYGNTSQPCEETTPLTGQFLSPYALQKASNECYAMLYQQMAGLSVLGLRYFNVYGLHQRQDSPYSGVIAKFLADYRQERDLTIFGTGEQTRDFIHVSDVAHANLLGLRQNCTGVLNIATGHPESLMDLVRYFELAGGRKTGLQFAPARPGDIMHSVASTTQAAEVLGFRHTIHLKQGIASLLHGESGGDSHA